MELAELQNIWSGFDKKIEENTRLNKEILKRMLLSNPRKRLNQLKFKSLFKLISPFVILIPFVIFDFEFRNTINFYIGLCLFIAMIGISYTWELKYYLLISKIDFSSPILSIKKEIAVIEKYKIKTTRTKYIFTPFTILSIFLMFMQKPVFNNESVVLIALILVVFIFSMYFTFKYGIYGQFSKLNKDIREIEELEKD